MLRVVRLQRAQAVSGLWACGCPIAIASARFFGSAFGVQSAQPDFKSRNNENEVSRRCVRFNQTRSLQTKSRNTSTNAACYVSRRTNSSVAAVVHQTGDHSRITIEQVPVPQPKSNEVIVRNKYAGLNFIDTYHRSGLYKRDLPFVLGTEGAGEIAAVGDQVTKFSVGDRVAYYSNGSYATYAAVHERSVVAVANHIPLELAAASLLQGMTAHYLTHSTFPLGPKHICLVHAGAGGTGQLITQMARHLGAKVIATASSGKLDIALRAGAHHVIDYTKQNVVEEVLRITQNRGVDVVFDGVGKSTADASIASVCLRGMCVFFGNASGPVPDINPLRLSAKSIFITRPKLVDYIANRVELDWRSSEVFRMIDAGVLKVQIAAEFPLDNVGEAHQFIEAGKTTGKVVIVIP